ncbi:MAG: hypothetical protein V4556_13635 [Bacteroidota bacterium]
MKTNSSKGSASSKMGNNGKSSSTGTNRGKSTGNNNSATKNTRASKRHGHGLSNEGTNTSYEDNSR